MRYPLTLTTQKCSPSGRKNIIRSRSLEGIDSSGSTQNCEDHRDDPSNWENLRRTTQLHPSPIPVEAEPQEQDDLPLAPELPDHDPSWNLFSVEFSAPAFPNLSTIDDDFRAAGIPSHHLGGPLERTTTSSSARSPMPSRLSQSVGGHVIAPGYYAV